VSPLPPSIFFKLKPFLYTSAWAEIFDVFGNGDEYEFALAGDDEAEDEEDQPKPEMKYQDVGD